MVARIASLLVLGLVGADAYIGWKGCTDEQFAFGYYPDLPANSVKVCRDGYYALGYDVDMLNPALSGYFITGDEAQNGQGGRRGFHLDPDLKAADIDQPRSDDPIYTEGTYDRGHLCPSAIMSYNKSDSGPWYNTYTMSNVAPQAKFFNEHIWERVEMLVRDWIAEENTALHMITGIAYDDRQEAMDNRGDSPAVPDYYWKVVCDAKAKKSVGVICKNTMDSEGCFNFHTVKEVEALFGYTIMGDACNKGEYDADYWWAWPESQ